VFTNPQFQVVLRALNQKKGIDVLSAPTVTTKSGNSANVSIVREFRYPATYSPPEIPQTTGSGTQPITPATPTDFEMRQVGVTLDVTPTVQDQTGQIDLDMKPLVTEFEGFINYGSQIRNRGVVVTENYINYPVFSERKVLTTVTVADGQTVALGGLIREDVQKVTDKTPLLGDVPLVGVLFRSQADKHIKRNLIIFVTAKILRLDGTTAATEDVQ
jgi:general secretion pathway protein D